MPIFSNCIFKQIRFLRTNNIFREKVVVQKKTNVGQTKRIVQKNEKIIVFLLNEQKKTKENDYKLFEQTS